MDHQTHSKNLRDRKVANYKNEMYVFQILLTHIFEYQQKLVTANVNIAYLRNLLEEIHNKYNECFDYNITEKCKYKDIKLHKYAYEFLNINKQYTRNLIMDQINMEKFWTTVLSLHKPIIKSINIIWNDYIINTERFPPVIAGIIAQYCGADFHSSEEITYPVIQDCIETMGYTCRRDMQVRDIEKTKCPICDKTLEINKLLSYDIYHRYPVGDVMIVYHYQCYQYIKNIIISKGRYHENIRNLYIPNNYYGGTKSIVKIIEHMNM